MNNKKKYSVPAVIYLTLKDSSVKKDTFISLGTTMYQLGYIHEEPRDLRFNDETPNTLELICTFEDYKAASIWYNDEKIKENFLSKLSKKPKQKLSNSIIDVVDDEKKCSCNKWTEFLLFARAYDYQSPLICGTCLSAIPRYRLHDDVDVEEWARLNRHILDIWFASGSYENWAKKQLEEFNSELNKNARYIMKKLRRIYNVPVYFAIWAEENYENMNCPNCGSKGQKSSWNNPGKVCKRCKLAFGYK